SNSAGASSIALHRVKSSFPQSLVRRQSQIIVRSQVNHFPPIKNTNRLLLALQHAKLRRHSLRPQLIQLFRNILRRILLRSLCSRVTHNSPPDSPCSYVLRELGVNLCSLFVFYLIPFGYNRIFPANPPC